MAQMKEKAFRKRTKQNGDKQSIGCRVQNIGNQDAHRMIEFSPKMKEETNAMQSEIKKKIQGTNSEGTEIGTQINNLEQKKERNI